MPYFNLILSEIEINKKLRSVCTQFSWEFAKVKKKTGTGTDEVYISKWTHFKKLIVVHQI